METRCKRFQDISVSEKMLYSLFLMTIGIGYLFALSHLYYTHNMRDGQPGISVDDVMIAYYGSQNQTRLGAAINGGPMEANLKSAADKQIILNWIKTGKTESLYNQRVAPILNRDCTLCHTPAINPSLPNLTTYEGVMAVAAGKAASIPGLVKVSHIHLFGIAFILLFVGRIFIYCELNVIVKRLIVVIPFITMLIDTFSWFITRNIPEFAYVVIASGALMGLSMGAQIIISLLQMWFDTFPLRSKQASNDDLQPWWVARVLARLGSFMRLTISPWISMEIMLGLYNCKQLLTSLYHIGLYKLNDCLSSFANDQSLHDQQKARAYVDVLQNYGYHVMFSGNGWLVKESFISWQFFDSLKQVETYVKNLPTHCNTVNKAV